MYDISRLRVNALWKVIAIYEARTIHLRAKRTTHAEFSLI